MSISADLFLDEIMDIEAKGLFKDLTNNINLFANFLDFEKSDYERSIGYIKKVLLECYSSGNLRLGAYQSEGQLFGYALLFVNPQSKSNTYLHKIFVYEKYRNNGIGTQLLKGITQSGEKVSLLCPKNKISFYEENGFNYLKPFVVSDNDNFKLSKGFYADLHLMSTEKNLSSAPIFLLNDQDLNYITAGVTET